jgi:hypothetical protein
MSIEDYFTGGSGLLDVASDENAAIRDNALETAQLARGRGSVYLAGQAGGMLISNLAEMAGMKTHKQEKAELITKIMEESKNLDPNDPKSSLILSRKFIQAGFPSIGQKFAQKYRDMSVKDRELGHKDTELELKKEADATLKAYYEKTTKIQADRLEFEGDKEVTRKEELAASLAVSLAEVTRLINKGELVKIPVKGNTTGALTWATHKCDSEGKNCTTTPLMVDGYQPSDATLAAVTDVSTTREIEEIAVSPTDAATEAPSIDTVEGLSKSGYLIADFGTGTDVRSQQLIGAEDREIIASRIEADYPGDTDTIEGIKAVRKLIKEAISGGDLGVWEGSLTDTPTYTRLESSLVSREASEDADTRATRLQSAATLAALQAKQDDDYKRVIQGQDAKDLAGGYILKVGHKLDEGDAERLAGQIGADINAFDMALAGDRDIDEKTGEADGLTPQEAYLGGYYEKALAYPGVYVKNAPGWATTEYDPLKFKTVLNKTFARGTSMLYPNEVANFARAGLIIPNRTVFKGSVSKLNPDGLNGTITKEELNKLLKELGIIQ